MIGIDDKYKRVLNKFGIEEQLKKLDEEIEELKEAIMINLNGDNDNHQDIEQELADVINVAMQLIIDAGGSPEGVMNHCTTKMIRTEKRIASGYYD